jgi:hypothetical protein
MNFSYEKLNRVHPEVDLRKYDALYFEGENKWSASREIKNGDDERNITPGSTGAKTSALGSGNEQGSNGDAGSTEGDDN